MKNILIAFVIFILGSLPGFTRAQQQVGWLVELNQIPLATLEHDSDAASLPATLRRDVLAVGARALREEHDLVKSRISNYLTQRSKFKPKIFGREFEGIFNGLVLDGVSTEDLQVFRSFPEVKAIYPNRLGEFTMFDANNLIGTGNFAVRDSTGQLCAQTGLPCLTGAGKKIGIIDSGVDYTHPDLGGSTPPNYSFQQITQMPVLDSTAIVSNYFLSLQNNWLIYHSATEIKAVDLSTSTIQTYSVSSQGLTINKLAGQGSNVFFSAQSGTSTFYTLYYLNLLSGQMTAVASTTGQDFIHLAAGSNEVAFCWAAFGGGYSLYVVSLSSLQQNFIDFASSPLVPKIEGIHLVYEKPGAFPAPPTIHDYRLDTAALTVLTLPEVNKLLDLKTGRILYRAVPPTGNPQFRTFDLQTQTIQALGADFPGTTPYSSLNRIARLDGNRVVFNASAINHGYISIYDGNVPRTILLNPARPAHDFTVENGRICFIAAWERQIYCHLYNPSFAYNAPPAFNAKVVGGYDFGDQDPDPMDELHHGTHVASIVAGSGLIDPSYKGVAPDATIYAYKVVGIGGTTEAAVIAALQQAVIDQVDVINLSISFSNGNPDDPVSRAVDRVVGKGIVVAVAAGNSGPLGNPSCWHGGNGQTNSICSPGSSRSAITVGASYKKSYVGSYFGDLNPQVDTVAGFSSRGPVQWIDVYGVPQQLDKPDIVAPGAVVCAANYGMDHFDTLTSWSFCNGNGYYQAYGGTSQASPIVAGAALLLRQARPNWTPATVKKALLRTPMNLGYASNIQGRGRLQLNTLMLSWP